METCYKHDEYMIDGYCATCVKNSGIPKWDHRFLNLAKYVSGWSKDPSTQTGAVIVRPDKTVASMGYNGFAKKMKDDKELYDNREVKYKRVIHCEMNAILHAREPLEGYILYTWPFLTCERCAIHVIQTGITRAVAPKCPEDKEKRWGDSFKTARSFYKEAGIEVVEYLLEDDET